MLTLMLFLKMFKCLRKHIAAEIRNLEQNQYILIVVTRFQCLFSNVSTSYFDDFVCIRKLLKTYCNFKKDFLLYSSDIPARYLLDSFNRFSFLSIKNILILVYMHVYMLRLINLNFLRCYPLY